LKTRDGTKKEWVKAKKNERQKKRSYDKRKKEYKGDE
jgi:hypothetical protein